MGRDTPPQAEALPGPSFFVVKDQSIKLSIKAARKVQERSRALVRESSMLIATAISLIHDARVASERRKARNLAPELPGFNRHSGHHSIVIDTDKSETSVEVERISLVTHSGPLS